MKKKAIIVIISIIILILAICIIYNIYNKNFNNLPSQNFEITPYDNYSNSDLSKNSQSIKQNNSSTENIITAVIVRVYEDTNKLLVINSKKTTEMMYISYKNQDNNDFKEYQEIEIYYNGLIITTYPEQISDVSKIKVVKENSNIIIPNEVLRYAYSSQDNINIEINSFNINEIIFTITDSNEIPYEYLTNYKIYQETKNDNYTGQGQMTQATPNSTSAYTRNRF